MEDDKKETRAKLPEFPAAVNDLDGKGIITLPKLNQSPSNNHPLSVFGKIKKIMSPGRVLAEFPLSTWLLIPEHMNSIHFTSWKVFNQTLFPARNPLMY